MGVALRGTHDIWIGPAFGYLWSGGGGAGNVHTYMCIYVHICMYTYCSIFCVCVFPLFLKRRVFRP